MATTTLLLGPNDHGRVLSLDDYLDAEVESGYRYELARGVLEVTEIPNDPHGFTVSEILIALGDYAQAHRELIFRIGGGAEFRFIIPSLISGRHPDVAVALWSTPKDKRGRRAASFAVEVVSKGSKKRDYVAKREEYLAYGLLEYWIVDPTLKQVTVLVREGDAWVEQVVVGDGSAESTVLPGFVVPIAGLWTDEDD